jgi:antitoxin VapB
MPESGTAKLFRNGRSQAVRLPREFRFEGNQVRARRLADGVLLEPFIADPADRFSAIDRAREGLFLGNGRNQPATPRREIMNYLLDTNACIALINNIAPSVRNRLQKALAQDARVLVSSIVAFELWCGVGKSGHYAISLR